MIKPAKPPRRNNQSTLLDECIAQALESMLEQDVDITHRAVVRIVDGLSAPSSITRDSYRRGLVEHYQAVQAERRGWVNRIKRPHKKLRLPSLQPKIVELKSLSEKLQYLQPPTKQ